MAPPTGKKIWFNGKLVNWEDAKVHVLTHALHYGTSAFEGIRCYETVNGSAIMQLSGHVKRLLDSCNIYNMKCSYTQETLEAAIIETIKANDLKSCYVRPLIFRGFGEMGVNPLQCPIETMIAVWSWGKYLGPEALEEGVDVCVSSWTRLAPNTLPALAKVGANYMNSQLIKMEAISNGYVEGISLDVDGNVCEGSGENIFLVYNGELLTPPWGGSILGGITRAAAITLAKDMGIPVLERTIPRELLYIADEAFFTGTAAEITPINSIDRKQVGKGGRGEITQKIQKAFLDIVEGKAEDRFDWLTYV